MIWWQECSRAKMNRLGQSAPALGAPIINNILVLIILLLISPGILTKMGQCM